MFCVIDSRAPDKEQFLITVPCFPLSANTSCMLSWSRRAPVPKSYYRVTRDYSVCCSIRIMTNVALELYIQCKTLLNSALVKIDNCQRLPAVLPVRTKILLFERGLRGNTNRPGNGEYGEAERFK